MRLILRTTGIALGSTAAARVGALVLTADVRAAGETTTGASAQPAAASDESYNAAFDKSTHDACIQAATSHGAAADAAGRYCGCVVSELDKLTAKQKQDLNPSSPELQAAQKTCQPQLQR